MELIAYREIQAESIGLIRQEIIKVNEEYRYLEISLSISGKVFPNYNDAINHYENSFINIKKALQNMDLTFKVL